MFSKSLFSLCWGLWSCYSTLLWTNIDSQKTLENPSCVDRCYTFPIGNHGFESSPQGQKTRVPTCCQLVNSRCRADRAWRFALQTEIDHQRYHWNIMGSWEYYENVMKKVGHNGISWEISLEYHDHWICFFRDNWNRNPPYVMVKTIVSCRLSLKPIQWSWEYTPLSWWP